MRDGDGSCADSKLNPWDIDQDQSNNKLEQERKVAPLVAHTVLPNAEESGSADNMVSDLSYNSSNKVRSLCVEESFRCITDLSVCIGRDSVEPWDRFVTWAPSALAEIALLQV